MRYSTIRKFDAANGPGVRSTLFVTGCSHNCEGCFNDELQSFESGKVWNEEAERELIDAAGMPQVRGISILGGEPLEQLMDDDLKDLLTKLREYYPQKSIWLWTGDIFEEAVEHDRKREIIELCDVVVDGPFIIKERNLSLKYRGSSNQRVIDVRATLDKGEVVLLEEGK